MNEEQLHSLEKLEEFINYCYERLGSLQINRRSHRKKKVLLPLYVNACDLAGSALVLLKEERINASRNLVRTLMESLINAQFIYANGSDLWVDSYLLSAENEIKLFIKGIADLEGAYPYYDFRSEYFKPRDIRIMKQRVERFERYMNAKHSSLPTITRVRRRRSLIENNYSIKDKTKIVDFYSKDKNKEGQLIHIQE